MIDIHSHILPEVDDGPKSREGSVEMCRMAAADGVTHMVATPHPTIATTTITEYLTPAAFSACGDIGRQTRRSSKPGLRAFHLSYDNLQSLAGAAASLHHRPEPATWLVELSDWLAFPL